MLLKWKKKEANGYKHPREWFKLIIISFFYALLILLFEIELKIVLTLKNVIIIIKFQHDISWLLATFRMINMLYKSTDFYFCEKNSNSFQFPELLSNKISFVRHPVDP